MRFAPGSGGQPSPPSGSHLAELAAGGRPEVQFAGPPRSEPYGRVAVFLDVAGNRWDLPGRDAGHYSGATLATTVASVIADQAPRLTSLSPGAGCACKLPLAKLEALFATMGDIGPASGDLLIGAAEGQDAAVLPLDDER